MNDLFELFPDLPWAGRRPVHERVQAVRDRAAQVRKQVMRRTAANQLQAAKVSAAWKKKMGR
jgi:hypothetical protein